MDRAVAVGQRRRARDRPDLPPRGGPPGVRGVPAAAQRRGPRGAARLLRRVRRDRRAGRGRAAARVADLAGQPGLGCRARRRRGGPGRGQPRGDRVPAGHRRRAGATGSTDVRVVGHGRSARRRVRRGQRVERRTRRPTTTRPRSASFAAAGCRRGRGADHDRRQRGARGRAGRRGVPGIPAVISFTVETDGRLPDGTPLGDAVTTVDDGRAAGVLHGQLRPPAARPAGARRTPGRGSSGSAVCAPTPRR